MVVFCYGDFQCARRECETKLMLAITKQTYLIHTNPHINVEAQLRSGGPNSLPSSLQLWPLGLIKARLGQGVGVYDN